MRRLHAEERRARLLLRHRLAPAARATGPVEATRAVVALHSTDAATVFLSTWARTRDFASEHLERALYEERALVRMLGMRRTLWVVPEELAPVVDAACTRAVAARERRRLEQLVAQSSVAEDPSAWIDKAAAATLDVSVPEEACPHNLAPTASTTATLAMGDAMAVAVLEARGFTEEDFARSHPGGTLGRRLLLHVDDVMRTGDQVPMVAPDASLRDGLLEISRKGLGMTAIVDAERHVLGIYTDGDLRRAIDQSIDFKTRRMSELMTAHPKTIAPRRLAAEAVHLMETHRITQLLVVDEHNVLVGALNVHDLFRAGVM